MKITKISRKKDVFGAEYFSLAVFTKQNTVDSEYCGNYVMMRAKKLTFISALHGMCT